ncbi:MAG TPA: NADH-quinone oxidoreductase subunit C [Myxococcaceae bacterium]|nr:NADH-quinone oxidoreductase subunit C [Myxococcaceae bacterium]
MAETRSPAAVLQERFPFLAGHVTEARARRSFADVPAERFDEVLEAASAELGFDRLVTIVGMDEKEHLAAMYVLAGPGGAVLSLRVRVPSGRPVLHSISHRFPGGTIYERELVDLLGFEVTGLPPGRRYPLPDDWPQDQKPLRKDWKPTPGPRSP